MVQPGSRSTSSSALRLEDRGNFRILKNSLGGGRCGVGSLLNLTKIPHKTSLQRSNSARECGGDTVQYSQRQDSERIQVSTVQYCVVQYSTVQYSTV